MIKPMEVTGINGIFRSTCINVMNCLRENANTVSALLDAFILDPLTIWEQHKRRDIRKKKTFREGRNNPDITENNTENKISEPIDNIAEGANITASNESSSIENEEFSDEESSINNYRDTLNDKPISCSIIQPLYLNSYYEHTKLKQDKHDAYNTEESQKRIENIHNKLGGRDGETGVRLTTEEQTDTLIDEARNPENLSSLYEGWCPFW